MEREITTYTYTARSADNADEMVTFTIDDHMLRASFGGVFAEKAEEVLEAEDKKSVIQEQIRSSFKPISMQLITYLSQPVHLYDVNASLKGRDLHIYGWKRLVKLRMFPFYFVIKSVDNLDAADAFVDKLKDKKEDAPSASRFVGPLDYWFGWTALLTFFLLLIKWPFEDKKS